MWKVSNVASSLAKHAKRQAVASAVASASSLKLADHKAVKLSASVLKAAEECHIYVSIYMSKVLAWSCLKS